MEAFELYPQTQIGSNSTIEKPEYLHALPVLVPFYRQFTGQTLRFDKQAARLFESLPTVNANHIHFEKITCQLKKAISIGALSFEQTKEILMVLEKGQGSNILIELENKVCLHAKDTLLANCKDIVNFMSERKMILADDFNVGEISIHDTEGTLAFTMEGLLKLWSINADNYPLEVAHSIIRLCKTLCTICEVNCLYDENISSDECYYILDELEESTKRELIEAQSGNESDDSYLQRVNEIIGDEKFSEILENFSDYYDFSYGEDNEMIANLLYERIEVVEMELNPLVHNIDPVNVNFIHNFIEELERQKNDVQKEYVKVIEVLINTAKCLEMYRPESKFDFEYLGDMNSLYCSQVVSYQDLDRNQPLLERADNIYQYMMETGESASIIVHLNDNAFLECFRNYQLGWLLFGYLENNL